jgi:hypothetical protein
MTNINLTKTLTGFAAAAVVATVTLAASGNAFAHGMSHMGSTSHNLSLSQSNTMIKTSDHGRDRDRRHRRFFSVGYVAPELVCVYKRTAYGLVKICPDDWY